MKTNEEKKSNLPAVPPGTGLASPIDYGEDFGRSFGDVDPSDLLQPIIQLLQTNSKACTKNTAQYVPGAEGGAFLNTITREVFDGEKGLVLVPCYLTHSWVEWVPHDAGGGFRGRRQWVPGEQPSGTKPDPDGRIGRLLLPDSRTELIDTRYLWCLRLESPEADHPSDVVVFPMTSSKVQPFRHWLNIAATVTNKEGKTAPPYAHRVRLTSKLEANPRKGNPYFYSRVLPVTQTVGEKSSRDDAMKSLLPKVVKGKDGKEALNPVYAAARQLWQDVDSGALSSRLDASLQRAPGEDDPEDGPATAPGAGPKPPF